MDLEIQNVVDHKQEKERVIINVTGDADLSDYIIADTTFQGEHAISNKLRHMHWFSAKKVLAGDKIILYTRKGTNKEEKLDIKNTLYHIFWQLDSSVWNDDGDAAILFRLMEWNTTKTK